MNFADNLKYLRKKNNFSQSELAERFGISDKTISSWENGRTEPNIEQLHTLSTFFNVSMENLIDDNLENQSIYGNHEDNMSYFADKPELLELYMDINNSENLQLLFDKTQDLTPQDLEMVLTIISGIRKERGLD